MRRRGVCKGAGKKQGRKYQRKEGGKREHIDEHAFVFTESPLRTTSVNATERLPFLLIRPRELRISFAVASWVIGRTSRLERESCFVGWGVWLLASQPSHLASRRLVPQGLHAVSKGTQVHQEGLVLLQKSLDLLMRDH